MTYKFDLSITANISSKVVEEIVRSVVEEQTGRKISKIETRLKSVSRGIGPSESLETDFDGFRIDFVDETASGTASSQAKFKKDVY